MKYVLAQGYRGSDGKNKVKIIKSLGSLDDLKKEHDDPIAYFTALAKSMNVERRLQKKTATIILDMDEQIKKDGVLRKNYGSVVYSKIYHELEIDRFLNNARRHEKHRFNTEAMMRLLL